jgi:predicted P-loop ATPase
MSDKKGAVIQQLTDAGYTLIPLRGKIPVEKDWTETPYRKYDAGALSKGNYGVALKAGDLVVDIDPRNFPAGDNPVKRLVSKVGPLTSYTVRTGGGGYHIYFRKPADVLVRNGLPEYPGIEFKAAGRQVVGPHSVHPDSGKEYEPASGTLQEIAEAPAALLSLISRTAVPFDEVGTSDYVNDAMTQGRYLDYLTNTAEPSVQGKAGDANAFKVACRGRDLGLPPAVTHELMLEVWNPRCSPPWDAEELKAKVVHAYRYAAGAVGSAHPSVDFDKVEVTAATPKELPVEISWDLTPQGGMRKTFNNLLNYMRSPQHGLHKIFAFNEFTGRVEFVVPAPWHRGMLPKVRMVGDNDLKLLKGYLATRHGYETSIQDIEAAITNVAFNERFHPVREYLEGLKWDGTKRLDGWLTRYLGVEDSDYTRAVARKVLCAAVMRVMVPGIKFDHVLVLEGSQDAGKSTVVEILGGEWASDAAVDPHSRDTVDALQGRWIIEMAEMEVRGKADEDALKAFITRRTDRVRLAYGRATGEYPRQSIFIATKNPRADGTYLKDDTGNRRWWPVRCEPRFGDAKSQVDFKGLKADRDQLFAEAVARMKTPPGEKLFMETPELKQTAKDVVAERHAEHEWTESIALWIERRDADPSTKTDFLTARDVFVHALNGSDRQLDQRSTKAIAQVLRTLGWTPYLKWQGSRPVRGYERRAAVFPVSPTEKKDVDNVLDLL